MKDASQMMSFKETGHDLTFEKRSDNDFCLEEVGWGVGGWTGGTLKFYFVSDCSVTVWRILYFCGKKWTRYDDILGLQAFTGLNIVAV